MDMIGIYNTNPEHPDIAEGLRKVSCDYETPVEVFEAAFPSLGIRNTIHSFLHPEPQPLVSPDQRYYAFAEGELYSTPSGNTCLTYLMEHFLSQGRSGWEQVNGQFVMVVYDQVEQRLHILNDRFGLRRFYYTWEGGRLIFGSQIKRILAVLSESRDFSLTGIGELMLFGHHFGESTLFEGIRALPPACILTVEGSGLKSERYWKALYQPDRRVDAGTLAERFSVAVGRQLPEGSKKGLFLTGGLDSRPIAYEVARRDPSIVAFTFGERDSRDVRYAAQICSILGLKHHVLEFDPLQWKGTIPQIVWHTEGESSFHHYKSMQFHPLIKHHCDTILTGILGGVVTGFPNDKSLFKKISLDTLVSYIFQRLLEHSLARLQKIFHPSYYEEMIRSVREAVVSTLSVNENQIAADILCSWNIEHRQRYVFMGAASDRYLFNIRTPFMDYDLFDYLLRVPAELRYWRLFYRKALWQRMPELRHVPWQKTGKPPFPDWMTALYWRLTHPTHLLEGRQSHYKKSFVDFADLLRQSFTQEELTALVCQSEQQWHRYFDLPGIQEAIEAHFARAKDHSTLIAKLLTLVFTERLFSG